MPYESEAVANYFLDLAEKERTPLSPMKIQKLVYFAHGWYLAVYDKPLLAVPVQAWSYGPVIPDLYHEFKMYGNSPIVAPATRFVRGVWTRPKIEDNDRESRALLEKVWQEYKGFDALTLADMTHTPDSPWLKTKKEHGEARHVDISDEDIRQYFIDLAERTKVEKEER